MRVDVLIPWRPDFSDKRNTRLRAWRYVRDWWAEHFPEFNVVACDDRGKPFSRGCSINVGAAYSSADVFVIADSDVFAPPHQIAAAALDAEEFNTMVFAFDRYQLLDEDQTKLVIGGDQRAVDESVEAPWVCISALFAIKREIFNSIKFDWRFRGWGFEDNAFLDAVETVYEPARRIVGPVYHLHHEKDKNLRPMNRSLYRPYQLARGNRERMREVLARR